MSESNFVFDASDISARLILSDFMLESDELLASALLRLPESTFIPIPARTPESASETDEIPARKVSFLVRENAPKEGETYRLSDMQKVLHVWTTGRFYSPGNEFFCCMSGQMELPGQLECLMEGTGKTLQELRDQLLGYIQPTLPKYWGVHDRYNDRTQPEGILAELDTFCWLLAMVGRVGEIRPIYDVDGYMTWFLCCQSHNKWILTAEDGDPLLRYDGDGPPSERFWWSPGLPRPVALLFDYIWPEMYWWMVGL